MDNNIKLRLFYCVAVRMRCVTLHLHTSEFTALYRVFRTMYCTNWTRLGCRHDYSQNDLYTLTKLRLKLSLVVCSLKDWPVSCFLAAAAAAAVFFCYYFQHHVVLVTWINCTMRWIYFRLHRKLEIAPNKLESP